MSIYISVVSSLKAFSPSAKFRYDISGYFLPSIAKRALKSGYFLYTYTVRPKYNVQLYPVNVEGDAEPKYTISKNRKRGLNAPFFKDTNGPNGYKRRDFLGASHSVTNAPNKALMCFFFRPEAENSIAYL